MFDLSQAVEHNNFAVAEIQLGQFRDAAVSLKQAVASLRQEICSDSQEFRTKCQAKPKTQRPIGERSSSARILQEPGSVLDESFSSLHEDAMDLSGDEWMPLMKGIAAVPAMPVPSQDGDHYISIYDQAFSIHEAEERHDLICAVIFYNLALVQHKRNFNRGGNLCKVLALYERAAMVSQDLHFHEDSILLLLLAISNNMMHIHATLFDQPSLQSAMNQFELLVGERPAIEDERFEFFVFNTIFVGAHQWRCAPVA